MTNEELNAEFSISITKKKGEPQMDFKVEGKSECVVNALIVFLSELTLHSNQDAEVVAEEIVRAYLKAIRDKKAGEQT